LLFQVISVHYFHITLFTLKKTLENINREYLCLSVLTITENCLFRCLANKKMDQMNVFFKKPSVNIIWQVVAGERFDYDDAKLNDLLKHMTNFAKAAVELNSGLSTIFPIFE